MSTGTAAPGHPVCAAAALVDGGTGVRCAARLCEDPVTVFFVRHEGSVHGYLNQCAHVAMELDWNEGQFFDDSGQYLICATHGALYEPNTGLCVGGPCHGANLHALRVEERDTPAGRAVFWLPDPDLQPVS
jgi:nitrite reductase/ring-hydroxylating ferredoxin subunit